MIELFHSISVARRAFITPGYTKTVREILNTSTENEAFLFSEKLNENINEDKTCQKLNRDTKNSHANSFQRPSSFINSKNSSSKSPESSRMSRDYTSRTNSFNSKRAKSTPATSRRHQAPSHRSNYPKQSNLPRQ